MMAINSPGLAAPETVSVKYIRKLSFKSIKCNPLDTAVEYFFAESLAIAFQETALNHRCFNSKVLPRIGNRSCGLQILPRCHTNGFRFV